METSEHFENIILKEMIKKRENSTKNEKKTFPTSKIHFLF
jgi:hypothetical protein